MTDSNGIVGGVESDPIEIVEMLSALTPLELVARIAEMGWSEAGPNIDMEDVQDAAIAIVTRLAAPAEVDARVEAMREALEPFAALAETWVGDDEDDSDTYHHSIRFPQGRVKVGWLRAASAALSAQPTGGE